MHNSAAEPDPAATVMVVDDDEQLLSLVADALRRAGISLCTASSGEEALRIARAQRTSIKLLLTDLTLPGISGRDLADQLSDDLPTLQVIYMSGYSNDPVPYSEASRQLRPLVRKPFTVQELVAIVQGRLP
jgi:DNA-binding NtrC family response regulator